MAQQVSVNEFVLELVAGKPQLVGGKCRSCGNHTFPISAGCPKCAGADMDKAILGNSGTLWAWTVQGFPPKSPPYLGNNNPNEFKPFGVGYVELPELIVEARLTESEPSKLKEGMAMQLTVEPLFEDENGNEVVTFAFAPSDK